MMTSPSELFDDFDDFDFPLCDPSQSTVNQYPNDDQQESVMLLEHNFQQDSLDNHCSPNPLNNQLVDNNFPPPLNNQQSSPGNISNSEEDSEFTRWLKDLQEDSTTGHDLQVSSNPTCPSSSSNQPPLTVSNHRHMNKSKKRDASKISGGVHKI